MQNRMLWSSRILHPDAASTSELPKKRSIYSDPDGRFIIVSRSKNNVLAFLHTDSYSAATAFVKGDIYVGGDIFAAIRFFVSHQHSGIRQSWFSMAPRLRHVIANLRLRGEDASARSFSPHHDRYNAFFRLFLDSRMQYDAGYFTSPASSLDDAQTEKLHRICHKLDLHSGQRLLDVPCGWGGLLTYAAKHYDVDGFGCTLSDQQLEFASETFRFNGLVDRLTVKRMDYQDLSGRFDRITSVGMFEHVGREALKTYFWKIQSLLADGGKSLLRGIVRPQTASEGPETRILRRSVFPGGELVHLSDVVREAERAGFEVVEMEDHRHQYALTCRAWVGRLQENRSKCRLLVGDATYRTWLLYLAALAISFEDGRTNAAEVVLQKRPARSRRVGWGRRASLTSSAVSAPLNAPVPAPAGKVARIAEI
jgi:cyclopropane-fatty-acyl-phospholipid synthase